MVNELVDSNIRIRIRMRRMIVNDVWRVKGKEGRKSKVGRWER